ncbi:hypothetical protein QBC44DRAFT_393817 [Cladorrhinum sp. PSN332]|nr:hypothetical protein QBC44DRAFT_393817 [Cladorrhinum sp. PSN332]
MVNKEEYEKEKEEWENIKKEYQKKKAEYERTLGECERNRGERECGGRGLDEGSANSQIPRPGCGPSGFRSRLEGGLTSRLVGEGSSVTGRGRSGDSVSDEVSLCQGPGRAHKQEVEAKGDDIPREGVGRPLPPSRIPVAASRLHRKEHLPVVPGASVVRPQRRVQTRLEVSRAGSPSRSSTLLSRDRPALGPSKGESVAPPVPPRSARRPPSRPTLANPYSLLSSSSLRLPGSTPATAPPVTPTQARRRRGLFGESWKWKSSSTFATIPPLPPLPPAFAPAAAATATTTTMTSADDTTTTPTMRAAIGAGPSGPVVGRPEAPREATLPLAVTEGESFWVTTPSPSPTKVKKVAVMATRSFGMIRGKLSRANLRDSKDVARVSSSDLSGSGGASGRGVRNFLSRSFQGTTVTNRASGPTAPIAPGDRITSGAAVVPTAQDPFSSSPRVYTGDTTTTTTTSPPMRPPRPSDANVAAAFALAEASTTADQDALSSSVLGDDPFFTSRSAPASSSTNAAPRATTSAAISAPRIAATTTPGPSTVRPPLPPLPPPSPERPALKKKKSLVGFFFGPRKEKKDNGREKEEKKDEERDEGGAGPWGNF